VQKGWASGQCESNVARYWKRKCSDAFQLWWDLYWSFCDIFTGGFHGNECWKSVGICLDGQEVIFESQRPEFRFFLRHTVIVTRSCCRRTPHFHRLTFEAVVPRSTTIYLSVVEWWRRTRLRNWTSRVKPTHGQSTRRQVTPITCPITTVLCQCNYTADNVDIMLWILRSIMSLPCAESCP